MAAPACCIPAASRCRGLAEIVNSGIQPLQNLSTTKRLKQMGADDVAWVKAFVAEGMVALANHLQRPNRAFTLSDAAFCRRW